MSQYDIISFLKKNSDKWFSAREINKAIGTTSSCTTNSLKRLREANLVNFKTVGKRGIFQYRYANR